MKSIERRFKIVQDRAVALSSFICFAEAIKGQGFSRQAISRWFNQLVDKEDYASSEKKENIAFLLNLSKPVKTTKNRVESAQEEARNST